MDRAGTITRVRRSLEVRAGWRALLGGIPAVLGVTLLTQVGAGLAVGATLCTIALGIFSLPWFAPEQTRRRLLAAVIPRIERDGVVTLEGIASDAGALLAAPYSMTPCIAYWARSTSSDPEDDTRDAGIDLEQRTASRDFTLDLGELRVVVAAARGELVFDRARATIVDGTRSRREEILLRPGDRVVVRGTLTRQTDAPFRTTAQLGGRVTVVLDARR